ncbi:MAG: MATE family efflux transporter [Oscillibacter sp.]|nr:MATE family efflux transporter [Oscillibacter sp.]
MAKRPGKTYEIDMCSGAILPKLLQFALPLMFSSILQLLFNAADIIVVGRWAGDNSLAAVGSNASIIGLLTNLFIGLSVGANILAARFYGAREEENLRQTVHTALLVSLLGGMLLAVTGALGAHTILIWMQSPPEVLDLATLYLRIYFLGMPATMLYNFGAALLRAVGDTRRPLYYLTLAGVINVVLNLFFVIVCHFDVAGVAIATVASQCVSALLVLRCLTKAGGAVRLDLRQLKIHPVRLRQIMRVGIPAGIQGVLFSLSNVVIQSSINSFGETVMAGNAAANNIETFIYASVNAFYQANISFTSQNLGAGRIDRIRPIMLRALGCAAVTGGVLGWLTVLLGPHLLGIYSDSAPVISAGMDRIRIVCTLYALCGLMDVIVGSIRGMGYAVTPMLVTLIGACGLRLLWIAVLFQIPEYHTIHTVYISYPVSWTVTFLAQLVCYSLGMRRLCRRMGEPQKTLDAV